VIQIDIDPLELGRSYPNTVSLLGDAKGVVGRLVDLVEPHARKEMWAKRTQELLRQWRAEVEPLHQSDSIPIRPERLCKELTESLPANAVLVADTGWSGVWTGVHVYLNHPGQRYIRAAGSLGWAFPAALGAKCAVPDRPVVCFTGDGGFWYHLGELETALRCGIKTVTVVNNNHGFRQCRRGVYRAYGDAPGNREGLYQFTDVNFAKTAQEWGCLGIRVEDPRMIAEAMRTALNSDLPAVVDVATDPTCQAPDGWAPGEKTAGF
jgi:acetolactate synthase I/II/III large subunit